jgi:PAS domain S-box-containing protein
VEGAQGRTHEGTGIGLALVQELVKFHHGAISVSSEEGAGTTFSVEIPKGKDHLPQDRLHAVRTLSSSAIRADSYVEEAVRWLPGAAPASSAASQIAQNPIGSVGMDSAESDADGSLIVLADDNADMRNYLQRLLSERYRVHAVANGEEAVKATRELHPDLVLTDVLMPLLDGFGVLRVLKSDLETKSTPVILLSARAGEESRVEGLQAGADDYLVKPFTARELMARVGAHLRLAKVRAEAAKVERLLRSEADLERRRLRESFILAPAGMAILRGPEHRFTFVNSAYVQMVGRDSSEQLIGKTVQEAFPEIKDQGYIGLLDNVFKTGEPFLATERELNLKRHGIEEPIYVTFSYQAMKNVAGEVEGVLVHVVDVTESVLARNLLEVRVKERTSDLQEADLKLRALNSRLLQAQDDERRRLARDLHDSAGQILVALKMNLFPLHQELEKQDSTLAKIASSSVDLVDDLSKQLRTMSHLLHPPLLDEAGLPSALCWYVEGFAERSGIHVDLELDRDLPRLPQETETAIFRIVQEGLTNIHRHSGSSTASVRIGHGSGKTRVEISDCGKGIKNFDAKKKIPRKVGVGIQGMQERVRQLEGNFEIRSGEKGTSVVVTLPNQ